MVKLYSVKNINKLDSNESFEYTKSYMLPFITESPSNYISNIQTEVNLLSIQNQLIPITINTTEYQSSYVCSLYNALATYSKEEILKVNNAVLRFFLSCLIHSLSFLLKGCKINKVVSVSNWLLSTNLHNQYSADNIKKITSFLLKKFPDHVIIFRSLNKHSNLKSLYAFKQNEYQLIPSRQVYIFDKSKTNYPQKNNSKFDFKLLKNTEYKVIPHEDITENDYSRIAELYKKLYLEKYSIHNPEFTVKCISLWHREKLLYMYGLRNKDGILDGVIGFFEKNKVITAPLVGYDTSLPQKLGLYRMLMALGLQRAFDNDLTLNGLVA